MDTALIAGIGGLSTLIGFVTVFVKIGAFKGEIDHRLKALEKKGPDMDKDLQSAIAKINDLQTSSAALATEVRVEMKNVREILAKIDRKLEGK